MTETLIPDELKDIYSTNEASKESKDLIPFMRIDYEQDGFKIKTKQDDDSREWQNIGTNIKLQPLLITNYDSHFDLQQNKVTIETNKYRFGEDIHLYNYIDNTTKVFKEGKGFKEHKAFLKAEGLRLKFQRCLFFKILEGEHKDTIFELGIKLSQSHGMKNKKYLFDNPMEGGLASYLNDAGEHYAMGKLDMTYKSYTIGTISVRYPFFTQEGTIDINVDEVKSIISYLKVLEEGRLSKLADSIMDT